MDDDFYKEIDEIGGERDKIASIEHKDENENEENNEFILGNFQQIQKSFELQNEEKLKDSLLIGKTYNETHNIEDNQLFYKYNIPDIILQLLTMNFNPSFSHILLQYISSLLDMQNDEITNTLISSDFFDQYMQYYLNNNGILQFDSMRILQVCILANKEYGEIFLKNSSIEMLKNIYLNAVMYGKYLSLLLLCVLIEKNLDQINKPELIEFFESIDFTSLLFDSTSKELLIRCFYSFCKQEDENKHLIIQSEKLSSFPFSLLSDKTVNKATKNIALELIGYFYDIEEFDYKFDFDILYSFLSEDDEELFSAALTFIRAVTANSNMIQYLVENNLIELLRELWEKSLAKYKDDIIHSVCNIVFSSSDDVYPILSEHSIIEFLIDILANYDETICVRQCLKSLFYILFSATKQSDDIMQIYQDRMNSVNGFQIIENLDIDDDDDSQQFHSFIMELTHLDQS